MRACVQLTNKRDRLCSTGAQRRKFEKEDEVVLQQLCGHIRHGQANAIQYQRQVDKAAVAQQVSGERQATYDESIGAFTGLVRSRARAVAMQPMQRPNPDWPSRAKVS